MLNFLEVGLNKVDPETVLNARVDQVWSASYSQPGWREHIKVTKTGGGEVTVDETFITDADRTVNTTVYRVFNNGFKIIHFEDDVVKQE